MSRSVLLNDGEHAQAIDREIAHIRDSDALGRKSKLRDLFDYLVDRSREGNPPREVEIAQDVFGRSAQSSDDGAGRVYVHRLRKRLEEIYGKRGAEPRLSLPIGEYRLVAEFSSPDEVVEVAEATPGARSGRPWVAVAIGCAGGVLLSVVFALAFLPWPAAGWREADRVRRSPIWAPLFANGRSVVVAEGDHYLFAEKGPGGEPVRLVRDFRIRSREDLDAHLLAHASEASRYSDIGLGYVPSTVPRAQLYLSRILLAVPSVRTLPVSQLPAAAMLSQNIVYLGLASGLGPLRAPVGQGSRFALGRDADTITDLRTGQVYGGWQPHADASAPRRQYGLISLFSGKEGNRYVVLAASSEMGLVGLVEAMADPDRLGELSRATRGAAAAEALYQVDSQGAGVLAIRLVTANRREGRRVWLP